MFLLTCNTYVRLQKANFRRLPTPKRTLGASRYRPVRLRYTTDRHETRDKHNSNTQEQAKKTFTRHQPHHVSWEAIRSIKLFFASPSHLRTLRKVGQNSQMTTFEKGTGCQYAVIWPQIVSENSTSRLGAQGTVTERYKRCCRSTSTLS